VQENERAGNKEENFPLFSSMICVLQRIYCWLHCGLPPTCVIRNTASGRLQH